MCQMGLKKTELLRSLLVLDQDYTASHGGGSGSFCCAINTTNKLPWFANSLFICFGTTDSLGTTNYHFWYDTGNNIIKYYETDGYIYNLSFPVCFCTSDSSSQVTSIDQVFNGFGYIGSTVFLLPGVKDLNFNGRNEDGSCKNRLYTETSVKTFQTNSGWGASVSWVYWRFDRI